MAAYKEWGSNLDKCLSHLRKSHSSRLTSRNKIQTCVLRIFTAYANRIYL